LSTRTRIAPITFTLNMASSVNSPPTILKSNTVYSYSVSWTGTIPVGTLSLQTSNDYALNTTGQVSNAGTWNTVPGNVNGAYATTIAISGNTGNGMIDYSAPTGVHSVRLAYTAASGTGTMTIVFTAKVT
jgi:hypothetical protein